MRLEKIYRGCLLLCVAVSMLAMLSADDTPLFGLLGLSAVSFFCILPSRLTPRISAKASSWLISVGLLYSCTEVFMQNMMFELVASHLLLIAQVIKVYGPRKEKDDLQIMVISFIHICVSALLSQSIYFAPLFVLYLSSIFLTLFLFNIRRTFKKYSPDSKTMEQPKIEKRTLLGNLSLSFFILMISLCTFLFVPRLSTGAQGRNRANSSQAKVGFSEDFALGGKAKSIKDNASTVMKVVFEGKPPQNIYFGGIIYEKYLPGKTGKWEPQKSDKTVYRLVSERGDWNYGVSFPVFEQQNSSGFRYYIPPSRITRTKCTITLEPLAEKNLFAPGRPYSFGFQHKIKNNVIKKGRDEFSLKNKRSSQLTYKTEVGNIEMSGLEGIRSITHSQMTIAASPGFFSLNKKNVVSRGMLDIPEEMKTELKKLAEQIVSDADAKTPYDQCKAIEAWLKQLQYTTDLPDTEGEEPIFHFLLKSKRGHCQYFASSFALLARSLNIPTRLVSGFAEPEVSYGIYTVAQRNAHVWPEVFFPGYEWIIFEPTPSAGIEFEKETGVLADMERYFSYIQYQWNATVIRFSSSDQEGIQDSVKSFFASTFESVQRFWAKIKNLKNNPKDIFWFITIAVALILIVVLCLRYSYSKARTEIKNSHTMLRFITDLKPFYDLLQFLSTKGFQRPNNITAFEIVKFVSKKRPDLQASFSSLLNFYQVARFGGKRMTWRDVRKARQALSFIKENWQRRK